MTIHHDNLIALLIALHYFGLHLGSIITPPNFFDSSHNLNSRKNILVSDCNCIISEKNATAAPNPYKIECYN